MTQPASWQVASGESGAQDVAYMAERENGRGLRASAQRPLPFYSLVAIFSCQGTESA